jgi:hypothetical protein
VLARVGVAGLSSLTDWTAYKSPSPALPPPSLLNHSHTHSHHFHKDSDFVHLLLPPHRHFPHISIRHHADLRKDLYVATISLDLFDHVC